MVEGMSVTGINPTGFTLDYGAFDEVSVNTAAHGPKWHAPGVHMQFLSKSGGNQYRGTLYADAGNRDRQSFEDRRRSSPAWRAGRPRAVTARANRLWSYARTSTPISVAHQPRHDLVVLSAREQEIAARQVNFLRDRRRPRRRTARGVTH